MVTILSQYKTINITENFEIKEYKGALLVNNSLQNEYL